MLFVEVPKASDEVMHGILVPWICFFAIATVVSIVAIGFKVKILVKQLRERRIALTTLEDELAGNAKRLRSHSTKLAKTLRRIGLLYSSMMGVLVYYEFFFHGLLAGLSPPSGFPFLLGP